MPSTGKLLKNLCQPNQKGAIKKGPPNKFLFGIENQISYDLKE